MALRTNTQRHNRPSERGQGAVEALITLPVFLVLSAVLLQTALLCMGQILLHYAVFCAARTGAVTGGSLSEMTDAAGAILFPASGVALPGDHSFKVDVLNRDELLQVRVTWNYPLVVPFVRTILKGVNPPAPSGSDSTIPLSASWTLPMEKVEESQRKREPHHGKL